MIHITGALKHKCT